MAGYLTKSEQELARAAIERWEDEGGRAFPHEEGLRVAPATKLRKTLDRSCGVVPSKPASASSCANADALPA
jgi:hypothetical protein